MITKNDLSILVIRILSLYLFLQALSVLPMSIKIGIAESPIFFITQEFIIFLLSAILWFFAPKLSTIILKEQSDTSELNSKFDMENVYQTLIALVGLILIVVSIPSFSGTLIWKLALKNPIPDALSKSDIVAGYYGHMTRHILNFFIGLILLIYPNFVTKIQKLLKK